MSGFGSAYDLAVFNGSLFVPDNDNDAIWRLALGTASSSRARP